MNRNLTKGSKMDAEKIRVTVFLSGAFRKTEWLAKPWVSWMGVLLICASTQVAAQVCDAEVKAYSRFYVEHANQYYGKPNELAETVFMGLFMNAYNQTSLLKDVKTLREFADQRLEWAKGGKGTKTEAWHMLGRCVALNKVAMLDGARGVPSNANPAPNSPQPAAVRPSPDARAADQLVLNAATAYAQKRQADVDRARQGKPKRHVAGLEAHNCLKPGTGGGVTNACPYAVEYSYCVFHPEKDTWSASFDCEKTMFGLSVIGPGPNSRSTMHTAGETTYWFACKYGETVPKPDGVSPADIEFQLGRGLLGRCAQWGSARG